MEDEQQIIDRNLKEGSPTELEIDEEMELDEGSAGEEEEEELKMADVDNKHHTNATCDRLQEGRRCILCRKILK